MNPKITLRILDDNGYVWLWDGSWIKVDGDNSEDGGYPASTFQEVVGVLMCGGYYTWAEDDSEAWMEGYQAYQEGKSRDANPYPLGGDLWDEWLAGWDAADEDELPAILNTVTCAICGKPAAAATAHLHQGDWIGDERLRSSE